MPNQDSNRRQFLTTVASTAAVAPYFFSSRQAAAEPAKNDRPNIGSIGLGIMGKGDAASLARFGDVVAVCDVDLKRAEAAKNHGGIGKGKADVYQDYRKVIDRDDVDMITIATPDHWHTKIALDAMRAGKDVYCQKPLTLTIDEGKKLCQVAKETKRVFQVGTQQRSTGWFCWAVALCRHGRLGKIRRIQVALGGGRSCAPIPVVKPPAHLDWNMWLGQAPKTEYRFRASGPFGNTRCHNEFRYWYEYSGGQLTDWGAHHVDIALWAADLEGTGPATVEGLSSSFPIKMDRGMPTADDRYNTATAFKVQCMFKNGIKLLIRHDTRNGILIEGDKGKIFVNRRSLNGKPVEDRKENPLPPDAIDKLYSGPQKHGDHYRNFYECCKTRDQPISDVFSQHRAITICHLANISMRLGRKIQWDPVAEQIVGDDEANAWQSREQRKGFEVT